jgi:uncharacterized membrane protein (TIGR02234 family)
MPRGISPRRLKSTVLLSGIAISAATLLSWTQQWFVITLDDGQTVSVGGDIAAQGLSALALAGLALIGALSIAGRVFRVILGILQALIGATIGFSAFLALSDPVAVSAAAISTLTGVAGTLSITALVTAISPSVWGWCALVAGVSTIGHGLVICLTAHLWPDSSSKYQSTTRHQPRVEKPVGTTTDAIDDWDALSKGDDPTEPSAPVELPYQS